MALILILTLAAWAATFFGGFALFYMDPEHVPQPFTEIPRFILFYGSQFAATLLAFICLLLRWSAKGPALRIAAAVPAVGVGVVTFLMGLAFFFSG